MVAKDTDDAKPEDQDSEFTLDMSQASVRRMIAAAKERGFITYEQLNQVMPPDQVSSEQIEDVMSMLSEMGINVVEEEEAEDGETPDAPEAAAAGSTSPPSSHSTTGSVTTSPSPARPAAGSAP